MSKLYHGVLSKLDNKVPARLQPLWIHPAGPKTIFFWAPIFKWALVFAGIKDIQRPAEKISIPQTIALCATGVIWSRYSLVIIPVNYSLFSVNMFIAGTQTYLLFKAIKHAMDTKDTEVEK